MQERSEESTGAILKEKLESSMTLRILNKTTDSKGNLINQQDSRLFREQEGISYLEESSNNSNKTQVNNIMQQQQKQQVKLQLIITKAMRTIINILKRKLHKLNQHHLLNNLNNKLPKLRLRLGP